MCNPLDFKRANLVKEDELFFEGFDPSLNLGLGEKLVGVEDSNGNLSNSLVRLKEIEGGCGVMFAMPEVEVV